MTSKMGYYNVEDYVKQKREREKEISVPRRTNLLAAADHIRKLFEAKKFSYAFMGGLEMLCLGYRRDVPDVQVAYDDKDFHKIRAKLESDQRVRLPEGMNSLFPAKILIRTGPAYKDIGCTEACDIELDLVPPGSHGTPSSGSLAHNLVMLSLKTDGKLRSYKSLNMLHLLKSLVHYCQVRDLRWDPRKDILFLCQHYAQVVQSLRLQLNQKAIQQNFLATPFLTRLSLEDQRKCYKILLGTEPPPTMAITPPPPNFGHKYSASDSNAITRPHLPSHKSSPSLTTNTSSGLLSPPLSGKPGVGSSLLVIDSPQLSELPAASEAGSHTSAEHITDNRESRSRYRRVSDLTKRDGSPVIAQTTAPKTSHIRHHSQPPPVSSHVFGPSPAPVYHLQPPQQRGPARPHLPKSTMNHFNSSHVPPYAFAQTPALMVSGSGLQPSRYYPAASKTSATPKLVNPDQHNLKSQPELAGHVLPQHDQISSIPITEHLVPPLKRSLHHEKSSAGRDSSNSSNEPVRTGGLYVVNPDTQQVLEASLKVEISETESSTRPLELDTISQLGQFIAELSAENSTPVHKPTVHQKENGNPSQQDSTEKSDSTIAPAFQDQTPPTSFPNHTAPLADHQNTPIQLTDPRTISNSAKDLPQSLIPGLTPSHQRTPSNPPPTHVLQATAPISNASRYTRYYASVSQTAPVNSPPVTIPASHYKAYSPPIQSSSGHGRNASYGSQTSGKSYDSEEFVNRV